ncbi:cytochrome P450 CYP82D47-like [Andrographis paniculata]|uniref:cytochrome P450 CYP82D47-like n=1 Tax=Andrographis paniculata TaxID=175694 RepID=UPI0021E77C9E|nr:cytochrome P450 CYP82D47-like [Andrographis paniculata]
MEFSSAIYVTATLFFLLLHYYRWKILGAPKEKLPPEAGGARPILGHIHLLMGSRRRTTHVSLAALADKHGPIFTIRLGPRRRAAVVSSWRIAKELFTSCDAAVASRVKTRAVRHLTNNFAMFGFAPYGPYWRDLRRLVSLELLSSRRVQLLSHVCASETARAVKEIFDRWEGKKGESGWVMVDMKEWFVELNFNVILKMVVGKRLCGGTAAAGEEMVRCRRVIEGFFYFLGKFVAADAVPWLGWFDFGGYEKRMKETAAEFNGIVGRWLEEHRRKKVSGGDKEQDLMDVLVSIAGDPSHQFAGAFDVDTVIKSTCQGMILGGTETSSVMLTWMMSLLLNNRHVLIKAQQELDKNVGRERLVKESDIHNLVYLQAIVKETLRLYPVGPLGGPREFTQDCILGGYEIPKGTWVTVNLWKLHRDPEVWSDDASEFRPERFLTNGGAHGNVDVRSGQDFEMIPFGAGRRSCPGYTLGLHMLHFVSARVLQAFEVARISDDEMVDMAETGGGTNHKATPLRVLVAPRLPRTLY